MKTIDITLKHFLPWTHLRSVVSRLQPVLSVQEEFTVLVDLTELTFISPPCLAALAAALEYARRHHLFKGPGYMRRPKATQLEHFLERVDFYKLLDMKTDESFSRQPSAGRFRELTRVSDEELGNSVSDQIAEVLTDPGRGIRFDAAASGVLRMMLWWGLVELMNNVFNHSESPFGAIASAQSLPGSHAIEACVVDCGLGVRRSLARVPEYQRLAAGEALRMAVEKGVTSQPGNHTGEGLYWLRRIIEENSGRLTVLSEDRVLSLTSRGIRVSDFPPWPGTLVSMRLDCRRPIDIQRLFAVPTAEQLELRVDDLFVE